MKAACVDTGNHTSALSPDPDGPLPGVSVGPAPVLLPQLVTSNTNDGRLVAFVTIYAPLHLYGLLDLEDLLLHDVAMTSPALDFCHRMLTVAEENKVGQFIEAARRNFSICHIDVTDFALLRCRETCQVTARRVLVARDALQL